MLAVQNVPVPPAHRRPGQVLPSAQHALTGPKGTRITQINTHVCREPPLPALVLGVEEFNQGRFFECHETLEALWVAETGAIRRLYQGILQIGVAFHHLRAGRYRSVLFLFDRGCMYLRPFEPSCQGIDIEGLLGDTERCRRLLEGLGPEGLNRFDWSLVPQITIKV